MQINNKLIKASAGMLDYFYPVGTIYETTSTDLDTTTKMGNHFGGTWEVYGAGRVLVAKSADVEFDTIGKMDGAKTHTLTINEMPSHLHKMNWKTGANPNTSTALWEASKVGAQAVNTSYSGGDEPHNNLPPYIVVYRYRRIA